MVGVVFATSCDPAGCGLYGSTRTILAISRKTFRAAATPEAVPAEAQEPDTIPTLVPYLK